MLEEKLKESESKKKIVLTKGKKTVEIPCNKLGMKSDLKALLDVAFETSHAGNFFERFENAKHKKDMNLDLTLSHSYDTTLIKQAVEEVKDQFYIAPVDATISRKHGQFVTTNEKSGQTLDVVATVATIEEVLNSNHEEIVAVEACVTAIAPKYTVASFENSKKLIASFSTSYNNSDLGRNKNLEVAAANISDTLLPGEVFSLAEHLEPITYEAGYRESNVIVNGKLEKGIGGGVCQVASTLYNAILLTNLDITMRQNHSLAVSYVPLGRDATYATGAIDFKFKNNLDSVVMIDAYCANNNVYVNIYSSPAAKPQYEVKFLSEVVEEVGAPETKYIDDPTLEVGQEVVETRALDGKRVKLYKLFYDTNGNLVKKVVANNSYYKPRAAVIRRGTKAVPAVSVQETPQPESRITTPPNTETTQPMNEWDDSISQQ